MKKIITSLALLAGLGLSAQVKVGDNVTTLAPGSLFEMESTNKGLMLPRVALTNTATILPVLGTHAQAAGMVVYNTATAGDATPGVYSNDGTKWVKLGAASTTTPLNVANAGNSYTATSSNDIILFTTTAPGLLTLPTDASVVVGKKIYVSTIGTNAVDVLPLVRETATNRCDPGQGIILIYLGAGQWSLISGY